MNILKHVSMKEAEDIISRDNIELMDAAEGVLLDDMIGVNEAGRNVLFKVCFVNCWSSDYTVYEAETDDDDAEAWKIWEDIAREGGDDN